MPNFNLLMYIKETKWSWHQRTPLNTSNQSAASEEKVVDVLEMDFPKVFNEMPHYSLSLWLEDHGIKESVADDNNIGYQETKILN